MKKLRILIIPIMLFQGVLFGQKPVFTDDTLNLEEAVNRAVTVHPTILAASGAVEEAEGRIGIARSGHLPTMDAGASFSRVGPVPSFDFPGYGTIKLFPENNYSAEINIRQLIYDFGRTSKSIELAEASKDLSSENLNLVRQNLAMAVISTYYRLLLVQESLRISDDELKNLNEHLDFIVKKQETGSATEYEIIINKG